MKQLFGKVINIKNVILGKVSFKNSIFEDKRNKIFVTEKAKISNKYLAVITSANNIESYGKQRIVKSVKNIYDLNENDLVTINENGIINVVFDIKSRHNAIFVTERCNSNCIMCPQPPVKQESDKFKLNLKYISLIDKKTQTIGITGGEPTLMGDKLFGILNAIHKRIPYASINLLSNGIKFEDYEYTKRFAHSIKQDLVIDIPLYSDVDTIHNSIVRTNTFYRTIKGIYNLAKFNIKIGIRIVVHKMNYERLPELAEYIYSNFPFVYNVAFMQMEPIGNVLDNFEKLWIDPYNYNKELENAVLKLYHRDMHVSIYNSQLCILPDIIRRFAVQSISDWKNIYLDECEKCIMKEQCPGFFKSAKKHHSKKIKPIIKKVNRLTLKRDINENDYIIIASKKLLKFLEYFEPVKKYRVADIPCGYGRNMYFFAKNGYRITGIDTDKDALSYIEKMRKKYTYNQRNINIINSDILYDWPLESNSIGIIFNIHFYRRELIQKFLDALMDNGYLYIETPSLNGNNYMELPKKNELKELLLKDCEIVYYKEIDNMKYNNVSVNLLAKKTVNVSKYI